MPALKWSPGSCSRVSMWGYLRASASHSEAMSASDRPGSSWRGVGHEHFAQRPRAARPAEAQHKAAMFAARHTAGAGPPERRKRGTEAESERAATRPAARNRQKGGGGQRLPTASHGARACAQARGLRRGEDGQLRGAPQRPAPPAMAAPRQRHGKRGQRPDRIEGEGRPGTSVAVKPAQRARGRRASGPRAMP